MIDATFPHVTRATVEIALADGTLYRYELAGPTGVTVTSSRDPGDLDLELGPERPAIVRAWPVQIGFAFSLPLAGPDHPVVRVTGRGPVGEDRR